MKKSILPSVALVITTAFSFGQAFEGKITYQATFKSKVPNVTDQQFTAMMGPTQTYVIKGGNYKTLSDGTLFQWQIYLHKDNKLYNKLTSSPSILYNDGGENKDEVIKVETNKNIAKILDYPCDELVLTCKSGVQKFYYNSTIKADAKLFENHKFGNWYEVLSRTNALPLKMYIDNGQYTMEMTASNVSAEKIDESIFALPTDAKIEKSPY
jgi:hypothetical protein